MGVDYGFFTALTGPMQQAGNIQAQRDAKAMQKMQLEQQQKQQQLQELDRQQNYQSMFDSANQLAADDLYTKDGFKRQKDVEDLVDWHKNSSGWSDIQAILQQHGSVDNARIYGNLDYYISEYKSSLANNPISIRAKKNKAALEQFHLIGKDSKNNHLITQGAYARYNDFISGKIDNFEFYGGRTDYLDQAGKGLSMADQVDIDEVIATNYSAIIKDMINDVNPSNPQEWAQGLSNEDIRSWVSKELNHDDKSGFFGGEGVYGDQPINTTFSKEIIRSLDATGLTGIRTGGDFFKVRDAGSSFKEMFDGTKVATDWDRLGGYDKNTQVKSYKGATPLFAKGTQLVASGRVVANNPKLETAITEILAGDFGDETKSSRYNPQTRELSNVKSIGLYDSRGHKITDSDIGFDSEFFSIVEESESMDLRLSGYHIALEGKGADGNSFLLTDVSNEEDMEKLRAQYKNTVFDYVMVAELIDDDMISADDAYYKKVEMGQVDIQTLMNEAIDAEDLNNVKTQIATYEQELARKQHVIDNKNRNGAIIQKQMNLPDMASVDELVGVYDQSLSIGLGMANIPSNMAQIAIPLLISDLYTESVQPREYPYDMTPNETDPSKKIIANNNQQYMAYTTKNLKKQLVSGSPQVAEMYKAIKDGTYDIYSQSIMPKKTYGQSRKLSKTISKYKN
jgi:hypothetical protein